ncbi:MAG: TrmB family transcriptional regulator [Alphaproteobacteria bacterium PRO2]|nr:TrmB family transcriptional regulator [Alphaproteobacteria bacterium PRO2]
MIQDIFEVLGFKQEEAKTYLALVESGPRTATELSKLVGAPRPTIYGYLERLLAAGLVSENATRGTKVFMAAAPTRIRTLYRNKIRELRSREESLESLITDLENKTGGDLLKPRLVNFEGRKALQGAMEEILLARPGTATCAFWPVRSVMSMLSPEYLAYHNKNRIRRGIHLQAVWPRSQGIDIGQHPSMAWGPEFKAELRYAPMGVDSPMAYWVYGNKTLFLTSREEPVGFVIESADMAQQMRAQHVQVWQRSEPVPFDRKAANEFIAQIAA